MGLDWASKFAKQLKEKELARQEMDKDFRLYKEEVLQLFEKIENKLKPIGAITITKPMVARTDKFRADVQGPFETINSLCLKCNRRYLEFVPEGINLDCSKGRIRIRHDAKKLGRFVYLHLVKNPVGDTPPIVWIINEYGELNDSEEYPIFDDSQIERIVEIAFLD